jgi:hypothetical protein
MATKTISDQLRAAIRASEMTSYALGKAADGLNPTVIDLFMRGERSLRLDTVDRLAKVLRLKLCRDE